jgi:uncharacterized protein
MNFIPPASRRCAYKVFGGFFLCMAILGAILPLLPTTPFVLLSLYFFNRSSPRMANWILAHPWLGPPVLRWQRSKSVSWRVKIWAVTVLSASMIISLWMLQPYPWLMCFLGLVWLCLGVFLLNLPSKEEPEKQCPVSRSCQNTTATKI